MTPRIASMLSAALLVFMTIIGPLHAQQIASATGLCGNAINASGHAKVNVELHCTVEDAVT